MWALTPDDIADAPEIETLPEGLDYFYDLFKMEYLPYLEANAIAYAQGKKNTSYTANALAWDLPTAPYRVQCLNELKKEFSALEVAAQETVGKKIGEHAKKSLLSPPTPVRAASDRPVLDRLLR